MLIVVVFPAPLGPNNPKHSLYPTAIDTSPTTRTHRREEVGRVVGQVREGLRGYHSSCRVCVCVCVCVCGVVCYGWTLWSRHDRRPFAF